MGSFGASCIHDTGVLDMSESSTAKISPTSNEVETNGLRLPLFSLIFLRFLTLAVLPLDALISYGDYRHFFNLARLSAEGGGLPFIGFWVEFPPIFPYLSLGIERLTSGRFHSYAYLLAILMLIFDVGNLWIFSKLTSRAAEPKRAERMTWIYMVFLAIPAFGWWTFEPMAVFLMLAGLWLVLERKATWAGIAVGLGFLTKIFPAISLVVAWRFRSRRSALITTAIAVLISLSVLGVLFAANPTMTSASLRSQLSKGSWETAWALIDGNSGTGTMGPLEDRLDAANALQPIGNPAKVPHWIPTLAAGVISLWIFLKARSVDDTRAISFLATFWCILLLWSRGWSPQWVAYLIPMLLLCLRLPRAVIYAASLVMVSLLEWPILLSRGRFDLLWLPVVIRTLLILLLGIECGRTVLRDWQRA